ncbi:multicopper oxidase domain-containing protein [Neobacillus niacini]|uniref:multicopper oxidase domain-containing protein n=1 Tax=Neobacillus niacini TaxID=86668 RepID=UPI002FFD5E7D
MTYSKPGFLIPRRSIEGQEGEWVKTFDPPKESPPTPEFLRPTNPVPAFVAATVKGAKVSIPNTQRVVLMHNESIEMWDGEKLKFFLLSNPDVPVAKDGSFPGPTIRVPRGVVFHGQVHGKTQPPHTIHWHGLEPTAINDGVGHTSMEVGEYTYQWQPNFIGSYFYHCHRNTVQHFDFGLYGFLIVEPPDAFDPSDGKNVGGYPRRTAANLTQFPEFPGFVGGDILSGDPHAMTVPYDVEAIWVIDDLDSAWMEQADHAHQTFPKHGNKPGINDRFHNNDRGKEDFFAFHDFNPDYFIVTGVNFPGRVGSTVSIRPGIKIPMELNSGVTGMQVSVDARINQTILIRVECAAYVKIKVTFPVDVVAIARDGRAFGVPPYGKYNHPFTINAGTPLELSTAQRMDVLIRAERPLNSFAQIEYRHHLSNAFLLNGRIPIIVR